MSVDGYKKGKTRRQRAKLRLHRGIDGRIKTTSAENEDDIGDVWAQQERIRLAEAIAEDKKRKDRKDLKKQTGLVGVAKKDIRGVTDKVRVELFGERSIRKPSSIDEPERSGIWKLTKLQAVLVFQKIPKAALVVSGVLAGLLVVYGVYSHHQTFRHQIDRVNVSRTANNSAQQHQPEPQPAQPVQNHDPIKLLPAGKSIGFFGGWFSSNIAKIGNVYNFKEKIDGVVIVVGQQSLASQTGSDPGTTAQEVADYFSAKNMVSANGYPIYIGTSGQRTQTVIFEKDDTLVLIVSGGVLPDYIWTAYANSLQPSQ